MAKLSTLKDDFNDSSFDLTKWTRIDFGLIFSGAPDVSYVGTSTTTYSPFVQQGLVKISSINPTLLEEVTERILTTTSSVHYQRFGSSIYVQRSTGTKVMLVGAPGTLTTGSGAVYSYSITSNVSTFGLTTGTQLVSPVTLNTGSQWGHSISGSDNASIIAVSAPGYSTGTGVVAIFTGSNTLTAYQTITSPFGPRGRFGESTFVSANGEELYIAATNVRNANKSLGAVAIYNKLFSSKVINIIAGTYSFWTILVKSSYLFRTMISHGVGHAN
jgi:hypothetical protein